MLETKVVQVTGRGSKVNLAIDDSIPFDEVIAGVRNHLSANSSMYSSGTISVNVGRRMLNKEELTQIKEVLEKQSGVTVARFWCPPDILEQALSESVGFGVTVSDQEMPDRKDSSSREITHNDPRFTDSTSSSDLLGPSGMEQWEAYILDPLQQVGSTLTEETLAVPDPESILAASDEASDPETEPNPEADSETPEEVTDEAAQVETPVTDNDEAVQPNIPDRARVTRIENDQEPVGLNRGNEALLIKTNCRSGEVIRYPGDVVIMADVNPGGEIIADGDILVFGNLRGFAHAGASGDIQATIIASNLETHRLQIGPYTGVDPKPKKRSKSNKSSPRIAYVRRRSVYVAPYAGRFGGYSGGTLYDG